MRLIDPRLLQAFLAVAREGNVSRAAARLNLSQPAVSLQLKELSELLRLELFRRTASGVMLTPAGAALLVHAERALDGLTDFGHAASSIKGGVQGLLRIGTILDPEITRLGAFLQELVALAPGLQPELQHGISGTVLSKLEAREIDVGYYLGELPADADELRAEGGRRKRHAPAFHHEELTRFTYRVVAPAGWGPQVQGLDWPELVSLPWIGTPPLSVHSRLLAGGAAALGPAVDTGRPGGSGGLDARIGGALGRGPVAGARLHRDTREPARRTRHCGQGQHPCSLGFVCLAKMREAPAVDVAWRALARAWRR